MKMRKFPDQGSSKLLWGRGVMTEGELPPPSPPYGHVWRMPKIPKFSMVDLVRRPQIKSDRDLRGFLFIGSSSML